METITILPLGTNGWMPGDGRETMCAAALLGDALILLDCGTGARRLRDPRAQALLARAKRIYILLSHYHLDHIIGLIYLPGLLAGRDVCIAGPGKELSDTTLKETLEKLCAFPFFSHPIESYPMNLELRDLVPGEQHFQHFTLTARRQDHTAASAGMRINDALAYATDTSEDAGTAALARGVRLLLHEGWLDTADFEDGARKSLLSVRGHTSGPGAARVAVEAGAKQLGLIHLNPFYNEDNLSRMESEAKEIFPAARVMRDLEEIVTNGSSI